MLGKLSFLVLSVALLMFTETSAKPVLNAANGPQCYDEVCPERTTGCKKVVKTSADKQSLDVSISCLDNQDMVLNEYFRSENNPYSPFTHYESTSFSGTYTSGGGNVNFINHIGQNGIENFA